MIRLALAFVLVVAATAALMAFVYGRVDLVQLALGVAVGILASEGIKRLSRRSIERLER